MIYDTERGDAGLTHFGMQIVERSMKGIENRGDFPNVTRGLVKRRYFDDDIKEIVGIKALRVFEEVVG